MMVVQRLKNLRENVSVSVGVATGRSFCGIIGSQRDKTTEGDSSMYGQRREYTVMGAMVNLAARLMCNAAENGVLVDVETQNRTKNLPDIQYESSQMVLKGLGLQTVWEPREGGQTVKNRASVLREPLSKSAELAFNARRKELTKIQKALAGKGTGTGVVVVITGGRGAGKGAVYDGAMEDAKELGSVFSPPPSSSPSLLFHMHRDCAHTIAPSSQVPRSCKQREESGRQVKVSGRWW